MTKKDSTLERLRAICLALPETSETKTWGHPNFRVGQKIFAAYESHSGKPHVAFKATLTEQAELVADARFRVAPYVGHHGWVALTLDGSFSWGGIRDLVLRSYRLIASRKQVSQLDAERGSHPMVVAPPDDPVVKPKTSNRTATVVLADAAASPVPKKRTRVAAIRRSAASPKKKKA